MEQQIKEIVANLNTPSVVNSQFTQLLNSLSGLRTISNLGNQQLEYENLIDAMMYSVIEHLEAETVALYLVKESDLQCIAKLNWHDFSKNKSSITEDAELHLMNTGMVGKAASSKKIIHILNCNNSSENLANYSNTELGSLICAPILVDNTLIGVIELTHPTANHFNSWQEHSIVIYSDMIGLNLNNHRLMHDMQKIVDVRTKELREALDDSEKLRKRYEEMSVIDPLTKLYNRRYFYTEVAAGLARAKRYSQPFSLMLMDLDNFKLVNDNFGHQCGDRVLIDVSEILSQFTREGDTLARIGGEEFVLALPETTHDGAYKLADRIINTIREHDWECNGRNMEITISIGLSSLHNDNDDLILDDDFQVNDIIREADQALYFVKEHGRNNIKSFSDIT